MKKRSHRTARKALSTLPLITAAVSAAPATQANPPAGEPAAPSKKPATPTFKDTNVVAIKELSIDPALPKAGETVTITLKIVNESATALTKVEWKLSGALSKSGSIAKIGPKGSQSVTQTLKAPGGAFELTAEVDPSQKISEPAPLRRNNKVTLKSVAYTPQTAWDGWASKAAARIGKMLEAAKSKTSVVGTINGSSLSVSTLKVSPIDTAGLKKLLVADGLPEPVAKAFVDGFVKTYTSWASKYRATVPFAYPGLAAWPGAKSAPMPNVPFVLAIGGSPDSDKALLASSIESSISTKLTAKYQSEGGAKDAIARYAAVLAGSFQTWLALQQATGVVGTGSVPSFAPPYVPVGPVSMGTTEPALTHLN